MKKLHLLVSFQVSDSQISTRVLSVTSIMVLSNKGNEHKNQWFKRTINNHKSLIILLILTISNKISLQIKKVAEFAQPALCTNI